MKGIQTTQDVKDKIVDLAKMGFSQKEIADKLNISERTAARYGAGYFTKCEKKLSGGNTYAIPKKVGEEGDEGTKSGRRDGRKSKVL